MSAPVPGPAARPAPVRPRPGSAIVASRSASTIMCMSSARPITPSSATDLCGDNDQLHARPQAVHEPLAAVGVASATGAEDRPPLVDVDFAI